MKKRTPQYDVKLLEHDSRFRGVGFGVKFAQDNEDLQL